MDEEEREKITELKDGRRLDIQVTASIQSVIRSKAGHKPGDVVKHCGKVLEILWNKVYMTRRVVRATCN